VEKSLLLNAFVENSLNNCTEKAVFSGSLILIPVLSRNYTIFIKVLEIQKLIFSAK